MQAAVTEAVGEAEEANAQQMTAARAQMEQTVEAAVLQAMCASILPEASMLAQGSRGIAHLA